MPFPRSCAHVSRTAVLAALVLSVITACIDPPFARINPNDEAVEFEMRIIGGVDTATFIGQEIVFQVVTDPVVTGYLPIWYSSFDEILRSKGEGIFVVEQLLPVGFSLPIEVRARFAVRSAGRTVVLRRAP